MAREHMKSWQVGDVTVTEVVLAYWRHAEAYYRHADQTPTSEADRPTNGSPAPGRTRAPGAGPSRPGR